MQAPLETISESDYRWCRNMQRAEHAAFSLVQDYLAKALNELDVQRAKRFEADEVLRRLEKWFTHRIKMAEEDAANPCFGSALCNDARREANRLSEPFHLIQQWREEIRKEQEA